MTQNQLNPAVARATAESLSEARHRGFGVLNPPDVNPKAKPHGSPPHFVDWDELDALRPRLFP